MIKLSLLVIVSIIFFGCSAPPSLQKSPLNLARQNSILFKAQQRGISWSNRNIR